jgi:hypothetical protein
MEVVEVYYFDKDGRQLDASITTFNHAKTRVGEWVDAPGCGKAKIASFTVVAKTRLKVRSLWTNNEAETTTG